MLENLIFHFQLFLPSLSCNQKTGRWNAMHVRIAWEIYHHQAKQNPDKVSSVGGVKPDVSRASHTPYLTASSPNIQRPHELSSAPSPSFPPRTYDALTASYLSQPSSHLGEWIRWSFQVNKLFMQYPLWTFLLQEFRQLASVVIRHLHRHSIVYRLTLEICL